MKQSPFIEKIFAKRNKRQKHIHTERENSEKKRNMETYGNNNKSGKSRNKEEIFSDVHFNSKKNSKKKKIHKEMTNQDTKGEFQIKN